MKRKLTDAAARNAKPDTDGRPKKYSDGGGLYLFVTATGKCWRYKYRLDGKEKTLSIGSYPEIPLKDARTAHEEARSLLAHGVDPSQHKQAMQAQHATSLANSFESVAREWLLKYRHTWSDSYVDMVTRRLERDIFPWIGSKPIAVLEPPDILGCLRRVEGRGALETAHRVKQCVGQVFRYAVATGRASRDPTTDLKGALPPATGKHFAAITDPQEIAKLLRGIAAYKGHFVTRVALQLSAYLFQRPGEIRHMEWVEVDMTAARWEIPAGKMKAREPHIVPLPRQVLALLAELQPYTGRWRYVFPAMTGKGRPMSENTVRQAIRRLGYGNDEMTAHGFRAVASTRLYEMGYSSDIIEKQLSHNVGNSVRRAYDRSQHLEQRTAMMQAWADYLDGLRDGVG